ncbi:MAG: right-handed parallel beta-helix repeat-containing protein [bacterium]
MSSIRRLWAQVRFRDVFLVSLIPLIAIVLLFGASLNDYLRARNFDDWYSREQTLPLLFSSRAKAIVMLPKSLHLRDSFAPEARDAGIIRLTVPGQRWDSLEFEAPGVWSQWLSGQLRYGTTTMKVRLRKRGDNSIHWLTEKRSLTIRTPRDNFYKSYRAFGLSGKEVLTSFLANELSHEFGLLSPATAVSPVFLNDRFYGTYRFVETVDESFLRPYDRMPGNVFRGDAAERGEYSKGVPRGLFVNPVLWDRASKNDRWTSDTSRQLTKLLKDVAGTTFEDHVRMMNRLDRGEFARLLAYLFLVGDPYHMDGIHNQLLYEDPSTQLLHPVPWDIRLLPLQHPEKPLSPLFQAVLRDPLMADSLMRIVAHRLEGDAFLKTADSLLRATNARFGNYLEYDRLRAGLVPEIGNADDARAVLRGNAKLLRQWAASDQVAFAATPAGGATVLDFETRGYTGADFVALAFDRVPAGAVTLRADANLNGILDASDPVITLRADSAAGTRFRLAQPVALLPSWETSEAAVRPGHMPYRFFVTGLPAGSVVQPVLNNRVTGAPVTAAPWKAGSMVREGTSWHPWLFEQPSHQLHRMSGAVRLTQTLKIPAGDTLVIEPGTTIRMAPDVSVISRGLVIARGTAAQPIRVMADSAGTPWGTFSLQGHGADSSIFTYVEFTTGGGALIDRIEYTGMVNVHRGNGSVWDHVYFHDNLRSDDSFHALHSRVHITNSRFLNANGDAIDFDISTGDIENNQIENSANDGIDLMTSTPKIANNHIWGSGDKGISIGEASRPFIFNNFIDSCLIGIEVKDRSEPLLLNNRITRNGTGLRERRKNWRYGGGGWATVAQTVFEKNKVPRARDLYSRLTLNGVSGLDSSGSSRVVSAEDLTWLYRLKGIAPPAPNTAPGLLPDWKEAPLDSVLDQQVFKDDLGAVSDGWMLAGGVNRLEKRRDALVSEVERRPGSIARSVTWKLAQPATLVLELSGRDLSSARVVVSGHGGTVRLPFTTGSDLATARFVTVQLPPGDYDRLAIEIEPIAGLTKLDAKGLTVLRGGRLDLRGYRVFLNSGTPK